MWGEEHLQQSPKRFFDLMVVSFEIATSHKYVVQKGKSLSRASSERVGYSFLVLIQI